MTGSVRPILDPGTSLLKRVKLESLPRINFGQFLFLAHFIICTVFAVVLQNTVLLRHQGPIFINGRSSLSMAKPLNYDILFPSLWRRVPMVYLLVLLPPGVINTRVVSAAFRRRRRLVTITIIVAAAAERQFSPWQKMFLHFLRFGDLSSAEENFFCLID